MRPFCDGTHRLVKFCAPSHAERDRPAINPPERDDHPAPPRDHAEPEPYAIAMGQLMRLGAKADSLLGAEAPPEMHVALRTAAPLIAAARLLLAQPSPEAQATAQTPCMCLIREALTALSRVDGTSEWGVGELVALLKSVAKTLERTAS